MRHKGFLTRRREGGHRNPSTLRVFASSREKSFGHPASLDVGSATGRRISALTADELLQLPSSGWRYELVGGELRKLSPSGARHGRVAAEIVWSLMAQMKRQRTGAIYCLETGFRISRQPDTVRAPDAAFVRSERVTDSAGFFEGPPDAAFEVVSPGDT